MNLHKKFLEWHFRQYPPEYHHFDLTQYSNGDFYDFRVQNRWQAFKAGYEAGKTASVAFKAGYEAVNSEDN